MIWRVADSRLAICEVMIVEALNRAPFSVYSLKIESKSSRRFCSSREFVSVEASTIKSLASSIADSRVY